jgi:hypothetical protein
MDLEGTGPGLIEILSRDFPGRSKEEKLGENRR